MADIFREVDEALREEKLKLLWQKHGVWVIAMVAFLVLGAAAGSFYLYYQGQKRESALEEFVAVSGMLSGTPDAAGLQNFSQSQDGYPAFLSALLLREEILRVGEDCLTETPVEENNAPAENQADGQEDTAAYGLMCENGRIISAVEHPLISIISAQKTEEVWHDFARLHLVGDWLRQQDQPEGEQFFSFPGFEADTIEAELRDLQQGARPWTLHAKELLAYYLWQQGDIEGAAEIWTTLVQTQPVEEMEAHPLGLGQFTLAQRTQIMLELIASHPGEF